MNMMGSAVRWRERMRIRKGRKRMIASSPRRIGQPRPCISRGWSARIATAPTQWPRSTLSRDEEAAWKMVWGVQKKAGLERVVVGRNPGRPNCVVFPTGDVVSAAAQASGLHSTSPAIDMRSSCLHSFCALAQIAGSFHRQQRSDRRFCHSLLWAGRWRWFPTGRDGK